MLNENELKRLRSEAATKEERSEQLRSEAHESAREARDAGVDLAADPKARREVLDKFREADGLSEEAAEMRADYTRALEANGDSQPRDRSEAIEERAEGGSPGERVTRSDGYEQLRELASRDLGAAAKAMGSVEALDVRETLAQLRGRAANNTDALTQPDRWPGVTVEDPQRPVRLLDVIMATEMNDNALEYVAELERSEAVGAKAYGNDPETAEDLDRSTYEFEERSVAAKRIGHYTPASEAQVADVPQFRSLIDGRLVSGVERKLEDHAIAGNESGGDPFDGIVNTSGVLTVDGTDQTRHDIAHKALTKVRITGFEEPELFGFHPEDFEELVLDKDDNGNYVHGRGANLPATIWGKPYLLSTAFPKGTPVTGVFSTAAMLGIRDGLSVTATDTHSDWFLKGWLAIKAQVRGAFGVIRPVAFCLVENYGTQSAG